MPRSIGLVTLRERAELTGRTLAIFLRTQGGTNLCLRIPRGKVESNAA